MPPQKSRLIVQDEVYFGCAKWQPLNCRSKPGAHRRGVRGTTDYPHYDLFSVFSREGPSRRGLSARPTMMVCCIEIGSLAGNVSSSASSSNRSCSDRALWVCLAFMEHAWRRGGQCRQIPLASFSPRYVMSCVKDAKSWLRGNASGLILVDFAMTPCGVRLRSP